MAIHIWTKSQSPPVEIELECTFADDHQTYTATIEGKHIHVVFRTSRTSEVEGTVTECVGAIESAYESLYGKPAAPSTVALWEKLVTDGCIKLLKGARQS